MSAQIRGAFHKPVRDVLFNRANTDIHPTGDLLVVETVHAPQQERLSALGREIRHSLCKESKLAPALDPSIRSDLALIQYDVQAVPILKRVGRISASFSEIHKSQILGHAIKKGLRIPNIRFQLGRKGVEKGLLDQILDALRAHAQPIKIVAKAL